MDFNLSSTQLFYQLIDKSTLERNSALTEIRNHSPELAQKVDQLLKCANGDSVIDVLEEHLSSSSPITTSFEGEYVDRYLIGHELGRGGFASVYYAKRHDSLFHHQYAIKFFHPEVLGLLGKETLFSEAQLLARLSHSNIAKVYDAGIYQGSVYIVMEFVDGVGLDHYLKTQSLNFDQKLMLFRDICLAIEYAHQNRVLHGDLKPENILVCRDGTPKIIDFNIAQRVQGLNAYSSGDSEHGVIALTRAYASPEQIQGESIDRRSDIYALGRVLYQDILRAHPRGDITKVVALATHSDPNCRYSRVKELAQDIENVRCLFPLHRDSRVGVEIIKKTLLRSPSITILNTAVLFTMVSTIVALSMATQDLNQQKLNLDTVLNDVTASVYPLNNAFTDWEVVMENREDQRRLLLEPPSRSFGEFKISEQPSSLIQFASDITINENPLTLAEPISSPPEQSYGDINNGESRSAEEVLSSSESVG